MLLLTLINVRNMVSNGVNTDVFIFVKLIYGRN